MQSVDYIEQLLASWEQATSHLIPKVVIATIILLLFYLMGRIVRGICMKVYAKFEKVHPDVVKVIAALVNFFFILSGVIIALQVLGLERVLTKLLAGAGVLGIIAGFAFKDIASNVFAGLLLYIQRPFNKGDWVQIDDSYGTVMKISWLTTTIATVPGQEVFVPNQIIYSNTFTNYSTFKKRRIILQSGVSYGDDLDFVKSVALDEVKNVSSILANEKVDFFFTGIGGSAYNFQLRFWISFETNDDYQNAMSDVIMRIKRRFEKENISIAYPVTTLDFGVKGGVNIFDKQISVKSSSQGDT